MMFGSFVYTRLKICLKTAIFELKMKTYLKKYTNSIIYNLGKISLPINVFQINTVEDLNTVFFC